MILVSIDAYGGEKLVPVLKSITERILKSYEDELDLKILEDEFAHWPNSMMIYNFQT